MSKARVVSLFVVLLGLLGTGLPVAGQAPHGADVRIIFIAVGPPEPASELMAIGAHQAAADLGADLAFERVRPADPVSMARMVDAAVASRPDGLVISTDTAEDLRASVEAASVAGIPVVSVGGDTVPPVNVLLHVGTDESTAGMAAGQRLAALGVTNGLCLTVEVGDPEGVRCSSAATELARSGGVMDLLTALDPAGDPSGIRGAMAARLRADPTIDGILMTDAASTSQALAAIKDAGRLATITLATFDLGADALDALQAGEMAFAVDQQPFLQGYLAVMSLALSARDGLLPGGGGSILVGPVLVTHEDAAWVRHLQRQGIR